MSNGQPTQDSVLTSLGMAAHAAHLAYEAAQAANPDADTSQLYMQSMTASSIFMAASAKALTADPAVASAQSDLDSLTKTITAELKTIQNVSSWITLVGQLVQLATTVAKFFA